MNIASSKLASVRCATAAMAAVLALLMAAAASGQQTDPQKLKDQLTGDAKGSASANPQCKLFTRDEIAAFVGAPVGPGENAAGGLGCLWHDKGYAARATVSVVPANYFPEPSEVAGFKRLPDVASKAWVAPDSGWSAGALVQDSAVVVVISGTAASEESAVRLLKQALDRVKK